MRLRLALALAALAAGCLLPQPPAEPRYFSPRRPPDPTTAAPRAENAAPLRLGRVRAAPFLRSRMVWRRGVEIGFYDLWRWTELPSRFLQTALETELFQRRGLERTSSPGGPTLEASLEVFEERLDPAREAAVALDVRIVDPARGTLLERSFAARRPIAGDDPTAIADALGDALYAAVAEVGAATAECLGAPAH